MSADATDDPPGALPRGTRLHEFELKRVLGIGGFGIVYLGFDHALEREVAIKEYMPASLAGRTASMAVSLLSQKHAESFAMGLRSFVYEARLLARFDDPSLVKVHRYWEANNTAYMAMRFYTGANLKAVRARMIAAPDEAWLRSILLRLLGALDRLHAEGIYHRDISPDNIILEPDGRPVLLDFGAARRVLGDISMTLTAILKPAYAPIEQYAEASGVRQGPWTDLYALGATMHTLLVGRPPPPATARAVHDDAKPLAAQALPGCSVAFLACIDWMLRPRPADRPQSVAALRDALEGRTLAPQPPWQPTQLDDGRTITLVDVGQLAPPLAEPVWHDDRTTHRQTREAATELLPRSGPAPTPVLAPAAPAPPAPPQPPAMAAADAMRADDPRPSAAPASGGGLKWGLAAGAAAVGAVALWALLRPPSPLRPVATPAAGVAASMALPTLASATANVAPPPPQAASPAAIADLRTAAPPRAAPPARHAASPAKAGAVVEEPPQAGSGSPALPARAGLVPGASLLPAPAASAPPPAAASAPATPAPAPLSIAPAAAPAARPLASSAGPAAASATAAGRPAPAEPEPALRARALGPAERCQGRVLMAYWSCVETQCKNAPELFNHPDCVKLRREQNIQTR